MRLLEKNKQKMYFVNPLGYQVDEYQTDDDGNIIFIEVDGEQVPVLTGNKVDAYDKVAKFKAIISGKLSEARLQVYGVSKDSIYAEIIAEKGTLPFVEGTKIWKNTIPEVDEFGYAKNPKGADYTVRGVLDEFLDYDWYLLEHITK